MKNKTYKINVDKEYIDQGIPQDSSCCPIALATRDLMIDREGFEPDKFDVDVSGEGRIRVFNLLNTDDSIKKIAWLGATGPAVVGPNTFKDVYHAAIQETKSNSLEMSYYDIDTSDGAKYWNINDSWENIKGYDLVVGWRVSPFCEDADHFS